MGPGGGGGEAQESGPGLAVPQRRRQTPPAPGRKDPLAAGQRRRQRGGLARVGNQAQVVPQPIQRRAHAIDATVEIVLRRLPLARGRQAGQQPVLRQAKALTDVHQQKGAGAIGNLETALPATAMGEQGGRLVHRRAGDRQAQPQKGGGVGLAQEAGGGPRLGQRPAGDAKRAARRSSSQSSAWTSKSRVREAVV